MVRGKSGHAFKQANCIKVVETFLSAGFGGPVLSPYSRLGLGIEGIWMGTGRSDIN